MSTTLMDHIVKMQEKARAYVDLDIGCHSAELKDEAVWIAPEDEARFQTWVYDRFSTPTEAPVGNILFGVPVYVRGPLA